MPRLNERQQKIMAVLNGFLGDVSARDILDDSIIVARIALDLATVASKPGFDPAQIEVLAVALVQKYTMMHGDAGDGKPTIM